MKMLVVMLLLLVAVLVLLLVLMMMVVAKMISRLVLVRMKGLLMQTFRWREWWLTKLLLVLLQIILVQLLLHRLLPLAEPIERVVRRITSLDRQGPSSARIRAVRGLRMEVVLVDLLLAHDTEE